MLATSDAAPSGKETLWGKAPPPVVSGWPGSQDNPRPLVGHAVHQRLWRRHALRPPVHRLHSENPALKRLRLCKTLFWGLGLSVCAKF